MSDLRIACVDVDYRANFAVAAALWFAGWSAAAADRQETALFRDVAPYQRGEFYRRELPCLLGVLAKGPAVDVIVIDGYVWLEKARPGLGAHLYRALGERTVVVGIAKKRYAAATTAIPIRRGSSQSELFVTAAGMESQEAASHVLHMHGPHRIPTLVKEVDRLARNYHQESA
jgi:deoxyribonuclease V